MAPRRVRLALTGLALAAAAALALPRCAPPACRGTPALEELNVLLVVLDTVGAAHLGSANPRAVTPRLDALARESVAFTRAWATAPWTQPSVASLLTSRMPSSHGVLRLLDVLPQGSRTLPEALRERGFVTHGVVSHLLLSPRFGLSRGFDGYDDGVVPSGGDDDARLAAIHAAVTSERVTDAARAFLAGRAASPGRPWLLFAHYFDPHFNYVDHPEIDLTGPYRGPLRPNMPISELLALRPRLTPADVRYLRGLHREEVAHADREVGRLLDALDELGMRERTLVVVAGDHGEEILQRGWIGHTRTLYEELLRVPLLVRLPGARPRVVETPVSLLDVLPTLLDLSRKKEAVPFAQGISLLPALRGEALPGDRRLFAEVSYGGLKPGDDPRVAETMAFKTAVVRGTLKVIHDLPTGTWEYFDLRSDPGEKVRLGERARPGFPPLRESLERWERVRDRLPANPAIHPSGEEVRALRSLGYLR